MTAFGSHMYGTERAESDVDYRGVFMPSATDILCQNVTDSSKDAPEELIGTDFMSHPFHRFLKMVRYGEPAAIDMAFAPEEFWVKGHTDMRVWDQFLNTRPCLLSRDLPKYLGFCKTVVEAYGIRADRHEAARKALEIVELAMISHGGLARVAVVEDQIKALDPRFVTTGADSEQRALLGVCGTNIHITQSLTDFQIRLASMNRMFKRQASSDRADDAKDFKSLHHSVRIVEQGLELLTTGKLVFPRANAEYLLAIKQQRTDFDQTVIHLVDTYDAMLAAVDHSPLPATVDDAVLSGVISQVYGEVVRA